MQKQFPWQILIDWFDQNGKHDFPWRQYRSDETNEYRVWLAEILLQQTQADRVVGFYTKILEKYPSVTDLAQANYDEFFPYYQGLGYYSRARNLLKTAKIITEEYGGIFPKDKSLLKKLPGVGEYTARAILAFGYTETILAWDTNLETIFSRYYKGDKQIKLTPDEKDEIEKDFKDFIDGFKTVNSKGLGREIVGVRGKKDEISEVGVRGEGTVGAVMEKSILTSEANSERVGLSLETFGTFGHKSMEKNVSKKENMIRNINNALMDWARLMEPKNSSLLEKDKYIFTESEFYVSKGESEIIEKKISTYFPIPDAEIIVILHQDHKIYYSLSKKGYSPFILAASEDRDTRKHVQDFFKKNYHLELSVRPIHKKWITEDGKPYIAVNAQVQMGEISQFVYYQKSDAKVTLMNIIP